MRQPFSAQSPRAQTDGQALSELLKEVIPEVTRRRALGPESARVVAAILGLAESKASAQ